MPTIPFCSLDTAYGSWNFDKPKQNQKQSQNHSQPQLQPVIQEVKEEKALGNINSFCPNCNSCLKANDVLQQRILETNISPLPQWIPQHPHAYIPFDPYNRYFMNNPLSNREDFGNYNPGNSSNSSNQSSFTFTSEIILQILLAILVILFICELVRCLINYKAD